LVCVVADPPLPPLPPSLHLCSTAVTRSPPPRLEHLLAKLLAAYGEPVEGTPFGRYRLVELLGRGGMGEVWRAHDTAANNRTVAIKVLPPHLAADDMYVERFRREADAAAQLNNPHVIPIHNYGEIDGRLYVDMRLVEGRDLAEVLAEGPLEPGRAVRIIEQVARALRAAHKIGLVHRDVKPSNILVDEDDFAYLIDFGIARGADQTSLTGTGAMIGSPHYMAPERFRAGDTDARADIYALACVLYECVTGSRPFPGETFESQITAHLMDPPPRPSSTDPHVPATLDPVVATGMAKDPDQRYATTVELANAAHDAVTTPLASPSEPTPLGNAPTAPTYPGSTIPAEPSAPASAQEVLGSPDRERKPGPGPGEDVAPPGPITPHAAAPPRDTAAISHQKAAAKHLPPQEEITNRPRWSRRRTVIVVALVLLLMLVGLAIGRNFIRSNYYVAESNGKVSIARGIQGSLLGISLHDQYLIGCLNANNRLSLISPDQAGGAVDCRLIQLQDLVPAARAQVQAGLAGGSLDDAIGQLRDLVGKSLLPFCPPGGTSPPTTPNEPGIDCRAEA
jgi:serine/threonine protein kinase